ncbi:MAG TPA: hypothetical protein VGQ93_07910, partial [Lysobacter sp.]|nr:hypothetical protein [Lysobacter sp.]
ELAPLPFSHRRARAKAAEQARLYNSTNSGRVSFCFVERSLLRCLSVIVAREQRQPSKLGSTTARTAGGLADFPGRTLSKLETGRLSSEFTKFLLVISAALIHNSASWSSSAFASKAKVAASPATRE